MKFSVSLLPLLLVTPAAGRPGGPNLREVPVRNIINMDHHLQPNSVSAPPRSMVKPRATSVIEPIPTHRQGPGNKKTEKRQRKLRRVPRRAGRPSSHPRPFRPPPFAPGSTPVGPWGRNWTDGRLSHRPPFFGQGNKPFPFGPDRPWNLTSETLWVNPGPEKAVEDLVIQNQAVEEQAEEDETRRGFSITQIRNPAYLEDEDIPLNGLQAMMQAYAKYGTELPPEITTAVRINPSFHHDISRRGNQTGSVPAYPERNDFEYLSPVQIGTPPQTLNLAIDTGSADLWVMSSETPHSQLLSQRIYTPTSSSTSVLIRNHSWSITYGDRSSAAGTVFRDRVALGNISYPYQTVESARRVSPAFTSDPNCSGILGLGMSAGNAVRPNRALTFMDNIRSRLKEPVFTADLRKQQPGRYTFGYVDSKAYRGELGYAEVSPPGSIWWQFGVGGFQVGTERRTPYNWSAIADTGTSLLLVPRPVVKAYYEGVKGSGYDEGWAAVVFPCESDLPDWSFFLPGGHRGTVPGRYMAYSRVNGTHCFGGMQSSEGIGFSVFGDVLLKAQFVVFDTGRKRVGFANKALTS